MAELTSAAAAAAPLPVPSAIERAEAFTRERFVHEGEDAATALAPGSARRRALDAALAELDRGAKAPSTRWRRRYALLLGLERLLSQDTPTLADGTTLNPHQVDALSGTLTALLAAAQNGHAETPPEASGPAPVLAVDEPADAEPDDADDDDLELDLDLDLDRRRRTRSPRRPASRWARTTSRPTRTTTPRRTTSTTTSRREPRTIPTPTSASGSSTRRAPARPSPRWASSRPRAPAAS